MYLPMEPLLAPLEIILRRSFRSIRVQATSAGSDLAPKPYCNLVAIGGFHPVSGACKVTYRPA